MACIFIQVMLGSNWVGVADRSPLQHLLLQMHPEIVFYFGFLSFVFVLFFSTVYVLPWTLPVLKSSFNS